MIKFWSGLKHVRHNHTAAAAKVIQSLRPYQQECLTSCTKALAAGKQRIGVEMDSPVGKTTIMANLVGNTALEQSSKEAKKVLILTQHKELAQAQIGRYNAELKVNTEDGETDVTVSDIEGLSKGVLEKLTPSDFKAVIFDTGLAEERVLSHFKDAGTNFIEFRATDEKLSSSTEVVYKHDASEEFDELSEESMLVELKEGVKTWVDWMQLTPGVFAVVDDFFTSYAVLMIKGRQVDGSEPKPETSETPDSLPKDKDFECTGSLSAVTFTHDSVEHVSVFKDVKFVLDSWAFQTADHVISGGQIGFFPNSFNGTMSLVEKAELADGLRQALGQLAYVSDFINQAAETSLVMDSPEKVMTSDPRTLGKLRTLKIDEFVKELTDPQVVLWISRLRLLEAELLGMFQMDKGIDKAQFQEKHENNRICWPFQGDFKNSD